MGWLIALSIIATYSSVGFYFMHRFTREAYKKPKLSYRTEQQHRVSCAWVGFGQSLVWPITLPVYIAIVGLGKPEKEKKDNESLARLLEAQNRKAELEIMAKKAQADLTKAEENLIWSRSLQNTEANARKEVEDV